MKKMFSHKKESYIRQDAQYSLNKLCLKHFKGKNPGTILITGLNYFRILQKNDIS